MNADYLIDEFWRASDRTLNKGAEAFKQVVKYYAAECQCSLQEASEIARGAAMVVYDDNGEAFHLKKTLPKDLFERGLSAIDLANSTYPLK